MKVALLSGSLPHYYVLLLNKMNKTPNLELVVYLPKNEDSKSVGKSVYQDKKQAEFEVFEFDEGLNFFGKSKMLGLVDRLKIDKPDILVAGWPYSLSIYSSWKTLNFLSKNNIKTLEKSIPYQLPKYNEAWHYFNNIDKILNENLQPIGKKSLFSNLKYWLLTQFRAFQFKKANGHICYLPEGITIYESYGVNREKIHVILNSPITEFLIKAGENVKTEAPVLPENPYRIVHIGRLVKWKKVHLLIEAVNNLKSDFPNIELLVIGDGPELENLKAQTKELGLEKNVNFVGALYKQEDIAKYMCTAKLYVLAGTGGLSINDAMCFSLPVVCSECDGTEKVLVQNGVNGYIFETDNLKDLTEKIKLVIQDENLSKKMGENSLNIIKNVVNEDIVISNYLKAFEAVTQQKI